MAFRFKIEFQDGRHDSYLGFLIETILAIVDLQVTPILLTKFRSTGLSVQEKKFKIDFQDSYRGGRLGFSIGTTLTISDLKVTPILPPWRPSWISYRQDFNCF